MPMKLKLDDKGNVVVKDDMPVYVHDDGKEIPFDANATVAKIGALNGEAKSHRERAEAAEGKLVAFKGIEDPAKALQALETMKNIDASKLVDAGKVEEVKAAAIQAAKEQFAGVQKSLQDEIGTLKKNNEDLTSRYANEKIGGSFTRSPFIAEKIAIPADLVQAKFGNHFKIEDGKIIAYDNAGTKIYSRSRPGDVAEFDEALEILVDRYPQKDSILKGTTAAGGGATNNNASAGGKKQIKRADFDRMPAAEKAAAMKAGSGVQVVD